MRTRLEVDGEVIATTRDLTPEGATSELADALRRRGVPAVAVGEELRIGDLGNRAPPPVTKGIAKTVVHRDVKPEKRRRRGAAS